MGLKTKYTIDKTKNFTKNTNLNPINLKDWPRSHGNNHSNRFSDLSLINKKNISSLEVAWIYHSNSKKGAGSDIQCNPIIVNGIIYSPVVGGYIAAIDGYSGKEIWRSKKLNRLFSSSLIGSLEHETPRSTDRGFFFTNRVFPYNLTLKPSLPEVMMVQN